MSRQKSCRRLRTSEAETSAEDLPTTSHGSCTRWLNGQIMSHRRTVESRCAIRMIVGKGRGR